MKKLSQIILIAGAAAMCCPGADARTFHIGEGSVSYIYTAEETGLMSFSQGETITIGGHDFHLDTGTEMWVDDTPVESNVVSVVYSESGAQVTIAGNLADYVIVSVDGGYVSVTQSDAVSASTCGEITYRLSGSSSDGSFAMTGAFKATVELCGLDLTSLSGAAIDIQNGKRIALRVATDTANSLSDAASGSQKGAIVCKGHLEIKGDGQLNVRGNASHAIYAKEYIELAKATVKVISAVKDGLNCNQYFHMKSGSLYIDGVGDDGVQVSFKDETDREAEDTGAITLAGGTINVTVSADAAKGLKCEGPMLVSGGDVTVKVTGNGVWDSAKSKTKASACLASDTDLTIDGGTLNLTATGGGGKGINCDGKLTVNNGDLTILTSGGIVAYVNGSLNNNYTGNTDRLDSDMKSSPKGIKADGDIEINGGTINVTTTGNGAEGIESKSVLTINDGTINVKSTDDSINSSSHMYIKGGNVTVIASGNDGLDSNGNMYIQGGYIRAFGARAPECGIDANEEGSYSVVFSGGTLLAVGGNNSTPSSSSGSTQPYVSGSGSVTANSNISLSDSEGNTLAEFTVPEGYTSSSSGQGGGWPGGGGNSGAILITCPGITSGAKYTLRNGNSSSSVTARTTGSSGGRP